MLLNRSILLSTLIGALLPSSVGATPAVTVPEQPLMATTAAPSDVSRMMLGHAAINDVYAQHLQAGMEALDKRSYRQAELHLEAALAQLRRHNVSDNRLSQARMLLAQTYLGLERFDAAARLFNDVAARTTDASLQITALAGAAETARLQKDLKRAHLLVDQALALQEQTHAVGSGEQAQLLGTLGGVLFAEGLSKKGADTFNQALKLLESVSGNEHQVADLTYKLGVGLNNAGLSEEAAPLFEQAFAVLDREAKFTAPIYAAPNLVAHWEQGNPRARLIADNEYPLKYMLVKNLRVAAAAVRSENVIGVVISLANCGRYRLPLAVGPVTLEQQLPKHKSFLYVSPRELDIPLEHEHITELTWRRRWLNHIEKTRFIPGYLKNNILDVDNFFGNNVFGDYGNWPSIASGESPIVTREEFLYSHSQPRDTTTADFLSSGSVGYRPTYLEPGESKTGVVFFKQERFDLARLRVIIGNTMFVIPFDSAGPR